MRGILNPPKYVLSLVSCQSELDKYEARVRQAKSKAMRDKGEELLDSLRCALEKTEGMDESFARHMPEANGKYIVFCAHAEHMREMINKAPEWFGKEVIDEVRDCRELFAKLEETLVASWELMVQEAKKYHAANGDLNVPRRCMTPDGLRLGYWLSRLRQYRKGKIRSACLTPEQEAALNAIGMIWGKDDIKHREAHDAAENQDPDRLPPAMPGAGRALLPAG